VRLLHESRPGKSHAVNRGVARASGDILLFTDDDVVPGRGWVTALATAMDSTAADFGVGRVLPIWEVEPPAWLSPALYGVIATPDNGTERLRIGRGCNEHVMPIGANMAVRASVIRRIGGWRAELGKLRNTLRSGEDHEFYLRMLASGFTGVYEPTAAVGHLVPAERLTRSYFRNWMHDNGRIVAALDRWYPTATGRLLGVPRYLWRHALADAVRFFAPPTAQRHARFTASARLAWFAGYVRASWFGPMIPATAVTPGPPGLSADPQRVFLEQ
jgi:glucosyl-dolichyl phosphate glucuronosyltransferase